MKPAAKQNNLTLKEKAQMLDELDRMNDIAGIMLEWKTSQGSVYNIKRNAMRIRTQSAQEPSSKGKRIRKREFDTIEKKLFKAFAKARGSNPSPSISTSSWLQEKKRSQSLKSWATKISKRPTAGSVH